MGEIAVDVSAELLAAILQALETPARTRSPSAASSLLARVVKEGFFATWQFEDYLLLTDPRLVENLDTTHLEALSAVAGAPLRDTVHRPNARSLGVVYTPAWAADDAASLLILLESLGFEIDPSPLVELLLPRLPRRGLITSSQLDIFWYARTRRKAKVSLSAESRLAHCDVREWVLRNGYKVETWLTKDGAPTHCEVTGPGFRNRKSPVKTVCSDCGLTWYRGDPDSSASHRKEHRKRMVYLDPAPDPNMIAAMAAEADPERVTSRSPRWKQDALDERALLFRQENHYSFVGWGAQYEKDHSARGFLMTRTGVLSFKLYRMFADHLYSNVKTPERLAQVAADPVPNRHATLHGLVVYASSQSSLNALIMAEYAHLSILAVAQTLADRADPQTHRLPAA